MTYVPIQGKCPVCHQDSANTAFRAASRDAEIAMLRSLLDEIYCSDWVGLDVMRKIEVMLAATEPKK